MLPRSLLPFAFAVAAAGSAQAQCSLPDNLNGPCCTFVPAVTLPPFPTTTLPGMSICWNGCNVGGQSCSQVTISTPVPVTCTQYSATLSTVGCPPGGMPELIGKLTLDYTRTWDEFPVLGAVPTQVWRFVVKADLSLAGTAGSTCALPSCLPSHPTAFYYGYLDYAFDCFAGTWQSALVLYHGCDRYQHDPLFSSRPGVFHPTRSYALVAPSTAANPFVPAVLAPTGGPAFFEGIRDAMDPALLACETEETIAFGNVIPLASACVCPFSFIPPQVTARHIDGTSMCGSNFRSLNLFPNLPWVEVLATSIGTWTTGASYPGPEAVWVDEGLFLHTEACTLTGAPELYAELKCGATTEGGYMAAVGPIASQKFTDLVNNYSVKVGTPILPPFFGHVMPTRHHTYVNYP